MGASIPAIVTFVPSRIVGSGNPLKASEVVARLVPKIVAIVPGASGLPGCGLKLCTAPCGRIAGELLAVTAPGVIVVSLKLPDAARAVTVRAPVCRGFQVAA